MSEIATLPFEGLMSASNLPTKGLISRVHTILLPQLGTRLMSFQEHWHKNINHLFTLEQWGGIWSSSLCRSCSSNIQMLTYKILYRWYMTPQRLHRIDRAVPDKCWRGCGKSGSFIHCWWDCVKVWSFWAEVQSQISLITGHTILLQPSLYLLNIWHPQAPDPLTRDLIKHLLSATRNVIAFHWKSQKVLSISD